MKIALMITCLADALYPQVGKATVALLERLGHEVAFPQAQTCCGQMHVNTGYQREALPLVRHHVEVFEPYEVVVAPSGSCVGSVRHQHAMVARRAGDEALAERAEAVAARTYELSELLVDVLGVEDVGAYYPHRVTYHPTCHSLRMLRVADKPLRLLRHVRGMTLEELPDAEQCCGFGGTFALKNAGHLDGDAGRQDAPRAVHRGGGADGGRCVVPDAHRRRPLPAALGHEDGASGRDPGRARITLFWPLFPRTSTGGAMTTIDLGMPGREPVHAPAGVGHLRGALPFPAAAQDALGDTQLRRNLGHATRTIRNKRAAVVAELDDWEELRRAGEAIKTATMARLDEHLERLEAAVTARGGVVHWARDANEANQIVTDLVRATGQTEVVKVKSMATQEIGLNEALEAAGIEAEETDLAELIVQLGGDLPSHILVPAIHRNRAEIREIFLREMPGVDPSLTAEPRMLAMAARAHLRERFLRAKVAISGANFAVAETGTLLVVESEGNGRMCLTLPETLITVMGIEKLVPTWPDLEVFLQLLPRSSTGERMNPYTSPGPGSPPATGRRRSTSCCSTTAAPPR